MRLGPVIAALIVCVLVALLTGQRSGGFLLFLIAPFLLLWTIYSVYVSWKHPERRRLHAILMSIWLVTIGGVALLHLYWYRAARSNAETLVRAVETYKERYGNYPQTAETVGVNLGPEGGKWRIYYSVDDGKPSLGYWDTFEIYATYDYDFDRHTWDHFVD